MIQIGRPYIEQAGKNFRLTADVVMDQETKKWWFEVPAEYKQYLCTERSDAFLIRDTSTRNALRRRYIVGCPGYRGAFI